MKTKTVSINLEVSARVDAVMVRNDYGVEGSPVWYEPRNMVVDDIIYIDGVRVDLTEVPEVLRDLIKNQAVEWADDCEGWW